MRVSYQIVPKIFILISLSLVLFGCNPKPNNEASANPSAVHTVDSRVTPIEDRIHQTISINDQEYQVEVVDTPAKTELGLSYRDEIGADGMLFILDRRGIPTFWMKGMLIDLDMIWIDCHDEVSDCTVVDITRNVPAPGNPDDTSTLPVYQPKSPVQFVLEVPAGWAYDQKVELGSKVNLQEQK